MFRFLLAPRWLALHAVTVAAVVGFVVLGWWQLGVYQDSQSRQQVRDQDAVAVGSVLRPDTPAADAVDRNVLVEGTYLAEEQLLVPGRARGDVLGSYVVTPLRTDDGMIVPVVRGWLDDADDPAAEPPSGRIAVEGHVLAAETPDHATGRSDQPLRGGQLGYLGSEPFLERTGLPATETARGFVLLAAQTPETAPGPQGLDIDEVAPIRDVNPWQNLSYWAQWWVFAAAAVVFWASIVRSAVRKSRTTTQPTLSAPEPSRELS